MDEQKIEHLKGLSVINATKFIMNQYSIDYEEAYKKLLGTDLYKTLMNDDSNLFLESDTYIQKAVGTELHDGKMQMYDFINNN